MKDMVLARELTAILEAAYTSDICMGLNGDNCFKGTPGVLKHYSGLPMANPDGPLNATYTSIDCIGH